MKLCGIYKRRRVLLVDSQDAQIAHMKMILGDDNFRFLIAHSREEALKAAREELPDLIVLDMATPGIDGLLLEEKLAKDPVTEKIPLIMITTQEDTDYFQAAFRSGCRDYVTKPVDRSEIFSRINNLATQWEDEAMPNQSDQLTLTKTAAELLDELEALNKTIQILEEEKLELFRRASESEQEFQSAVNVLVSYQMFSSSGNTAEIVQTVCEIITNLVGSEDFGLFMIRGVCEDLKYTLIASGINDRPLADYPSKWKELAQSTLESGKLQFEDAPPEEYPAAAIPILIGEDPIGVLIINCTLPQKQRFNKTDAEILRTLSLSLGDALLAMHGREEFQDKHWENDFRTYVISNAQMTGN